MGPSEALHGAHRIRQLGRMHVPSRIMTAVFCMLLLLTGCGSGALSGPDGSKGADTKSDGADTNDTNTGDGGRSSSGTGGSNGGSGSSDNAGGNGGKRKDRFDYSFSLPLGDRNQSDNLFHVHEPLKKNDCAGAQKALEEYWSTFSPGEVLLYQSAIYACRGDIQQATSLYNRAVAFGWYLPKGQSNACFAQQAVQSFIDQKPVSSWECEEQRAKKSYPNNEPLDPRDNGNDAFPDTEQRSVDESSSTTDSSSTQPTDSSSTQPTDSSSTQPTDSVSSNTVSSLGSG
jgi:predicted small lipoprotein YifL